MLTRNYQHKWIAVRALTAALCFSLAGTGGLYAQATATISGTVADMSGAAIPGTSIQVKNLGTGLSQSISTDAQGRYTVPNW